MKVAAEQGYTPEATLPFGLEGAFPMMRLGSQSAEKTIPGGAVHVISTPIFFPATPYYCLVASDVDAPLLVAEITKRYVDAPTRYHVVHVEGAPAGPLVLNAQGQGSVDTIVAMRVHKIPPTFRVLVLAYRIDAASTAMAGEIKKGCDRGAVKRDADIICQKQSFP